MIIKKNIRLLTVSENNQIATMKFRNMQKVDYLYPIIGTSFGQIYEIINLNHRKSSIFYKAKVLTISLMRIKQKFLKCNMNMYG